MVNSITQKLKYKQSIIKFSFKYGVTKEAIKFGENRRNEHTEEEIKMIRNYKANNKETGLVVLWIQLRNAGYKISVTSLYRIMIKLVIYNKAPSKKKEKNAGYYPEMTYPGEKIPIDVKYVPKKCLSKKIQEMGERYYQYTTIDEYSTYRYLCFTNAHDTYASTEFLERVIKVFPFKIEKVQTDNGFEFINRLSWQAFVKDKKTMFENRLEELGIEHKCIKPHTPKQNGKVERSHRKDQERFYYNKEFCSLEDLRNRAKYWIKEYNNFPMRPLGWLSLKEKLEEYMCKVK